MIQDRQKIKKILSQFSQNSSISLTTYNQGLSLTLIIKVEFQKIIYNLLS